jgi:Icc-related predicted phosphoesterase
MSDTHYTNRHMKEIEVPEGDVLIHAGDATFEGSRNETKRFARWYASHPHPYKIFVAGNHDWIFERNPEGGKRILGPSIIYLRDNMTEIGGFKIYGSPWQPEFQNWAFNLPREGDALVKKWTQIPHGIDVLITHGPAYGILDRTTFGDRPRVGCEELRRCLDRLRRAHMRLRPVHVFGHIHGEYGIQRFDRDAISINASLCDEGYRVARPPIVFDIS